VILGGDDLTDHGQRVAGVNQEGWLYIEKAVSNLNSGVTRPGASGIAALGSAEVVGCPPVCPGGNAGAGIDSAASNLGLAVTFSNGAAAINQFFTDLASGAQNPSIIWIAGTGAANDLDFDGEGAALTANAAAINSFVASGGGLMSHGSGTEAYGWLSTLLPGLADSGSCNSTGATLTAAGQAAFPGLSNSDIDANAGPCHSSFAGNFGGLVALGLDGQGLPYIIGGGPGTVIQCGQPGQPACPTPEPSSLMLLGAGIIGLGWSIRRSGRPGNCVSNPGGARAPSA
jgi:hypothetical protein